MVSNVKSRSLVMLLLPAAALLAFSVAAAGPGAASSPTETTAPLSAPSPVESGKNGGRDNGTVRRATGAGGSFGSWLWDYLTRGASITAGIGTRQAELTVTDKRTAAAGRISQRDEEAYFLSYSTRPSFFGDTRFGYTFLFNYTTFHMDRQEVAKNVYVDLGTRIRGRVAYVVPTGFFQIGEHGPEGRYVRMGVGLGLGMAKYEGSIVLDYPNNTVPVNVTNGSYDPKFAGSLFLEGRYGPWGIHLSAAGPSYEDETYRYAVSDIAYYLGYTLYI